MKNICVLIGFLFLSLGTLAQKFPDSQKGGKYVTVNGAKLWVVMVGKGDPMVIIPGGPGGSHPSYRVFDSMAEHNTIVYYDAFGRGKSDTAKRLEEYTIERDIDDLDGLRAALGFSKWNVFGHSYGGVVAQGYALKYPSRVSHLVLANTFHSFIMWQANDDNCNHEIKTNYPEVWDELMKIREAGAVSMDSAHQELYGRVPYGFMYAYNPDNFANRDSKPYPNKFNSRLYYQMVGKDGDFIVGNDIGNFDYRTQLKKLKMPVLIYGGRYDRVAVPAMMVKFKTYCPQAKFLMFERSGHNPQVEQQKKLFRLLEDFLHDEKDTAN